MVAAAVQQHHVDLSHRKQRSGLESVFLPASQPCWDSMCSVCRLDYFGSSEQNLDLVDLNLFSFHSQCVAEITGIQCHILLQLML